jgi:hypothetical protein
MSYIGFDKDLPTLQEINDKPSSNLPMIIAKVKTKIYMGKGINFYCDDEKAMEK